MLSDHQTRIRRCQSRYKNFILSVSFLQVEVLILFQKPKSIFFRRFLKSEALLHENFKTIKQLTVMSKGLYAKEFPRDVN